jgi:hypothetical protein
MWEAWKKISNESLERASAAVIRRNQTLLIKKKLLCGKFTFVVYRYIYVVFDVDEVPFKDIWKLD